MTVQRDLGVLRYSLSSGGIFDNSGGVFERFYFGAVKLSKRVKI